MSYGIIILIGVIFCASLEILRVIFFKKIFEKNIGSLMKNKVDRLAAILSWLLITGGLLIFVISNPLVIDIGDALSMGMIFGLIVYGIYECTNQALLIKRNRTLVLTDIGRGMFFCGVVSAMLWYIAQYLQIL